MRLSEVNLESGQEEVYCEVDDFGAVGDNMNVYIGLAKSGTEEHVIRQLHRAGSLDASRIMPELDGEVANVTEEQKQ